MTRLTPLLGCALLVSCASPRAAAPPPVLDAATGSPSLQSQPADPVVAAVGAGMAAHELANRKDAVVLGHTLEIAGDRASFLVCSAADACGTRRVDLPASAVHGVKVIGRTRPVRGDGTPGDETDVLQITIAAELATSRGAFTGIIP